MLMQINAGLPDVYTPCLSDGLCCTSSAYTSVSGVLLMDQLKGDYLCKILHYIVPM